MDGGFEEMLIKYFKERKIRRCKKQYENGYAFAAFELLKKNMSVNEIYEWIDYDLMFDPCESAFRGGMYDAVEDYENVRK